jgi:hypothetical protein
VIAPTVAEVESWSKLNFSELEFADDAQMQVLIDRATENILNAAGRTLASMPENLVHTARHAIQMYVEQLALRAQPDVLETAADFDLIGSFSVTGYSETRRGIDEYVKAKFLNAYGPLHDALLAIMTPEKRDDWIFFLTGEYPPALAFATLDVGFDADSREP